MRACATATDSGGFMRMRTKRPRLHTHRRASEKAVWMKKKVTLAGVACARVCVCAWVGEA